MFDLLFGWRKASKCKKLIRRVQCRMKLLMNKRSCIVKQLREDVAELLKNGHHQTAFQRVEQVVVDENMVQIYDLLYQYCEYVIINLPYIRKHRDCPNDISEAVSTLIFSSARFGELPELLSIRELFGERYGRKFVSAALQLLPGNLIKHQIVENLEMKKVGDDVKHKFLNDIAGSSIEAGPLMLEYNKSDLQEDKNDSMITLLDEDNKSRTETCFGLRKEGVGSNEFDYSSESSATLGEEVIYLDDIEERMSPVIKDGNLQDQRLFVFKSDHGFELPTALKKRTRRRSVRLSLNTAYYGESDDIRPRRKSRHQRESQEDSRIKKCSLEQPCYLDKAEEVAHKQTPLPSIWRAMTMPCERPKDNTASDNINRSSSFPFGQSFHFCSPRQHIHPKLPDYDELAAKFMELKRENIQRSEASKSG